MHFDPYATSTADPKMPKSKNSTQAASLNHLQDHQALSEQLHHVLVSSSHLAKDPTQQIEKLRIVGTYDSLPCAKAATYRALFEAGYEDTFFQAYGVNADFFDAQNIPVEDRNGLLVHAVADDNTIFQARVMTTPNKAHWTRSSDDGRIGKDLCYVVRTAASYSDGSEGINSRAHNIEGVFDSYEDARRAARMALLDEVDEVTKESYAQYDEAKDDEIDCGYGENVLVHAVGEDGLNLLVSVVKGQVLESVRLMEASMRIR